MWACVHVQVTMHGILLTGVRAAMLITKRRECAAFLDSATCAPHNTLHLRPRRQRVRNRQSPQCCSKHESGPAQKTPHHAPVVWRAAVERRETPLRKVFLDSRGLSITIASAQNQLRTLQSSQSRSSELIEFWTLQVLNLFFSFKELRADKM